MREWRTGHRSRTQLVDEKKPESRRGPWKTAHPSVLATRPSSSFVFDGARGARKMNLLFSLSPFSFSTRALPRSSDAINSVLLAYIPVKCCGSPLQLQLERYTARRLSLFPFKNALSLSLAAFPLSLFVYIIPSRPSPDEMEGAYSFLLFLPALPFFFHPSLIPSLSRFEKKETRRLRNNTPARRSSGRRCS